MVILVSGGEIIGPHATLHERRERMAIEAACVRSARGREMSVSAAARSGLCGPGYADRGRAGIGEQLARAARTPASSRRGDHQGQVQARQRRLRLHLFDRPFAAGAICCADMRAARPVQAVTDPAKGGMKHGKTARQGRLAAPAGLSASLVSIRLIPYRVSARLAARRRPHRRAGRA